MLRKIAYVEEEEPVIEEEDTEDIIKIDGKKYRRLSLEMPEYDRQDLIYHLQKVLVWRKVPKISPSGL